MKDRPADIDDAALVEALRGGWGLTVPEGGLRYAPVGFGDHHWQAVDAAGTRWFVTVAARRDGLLRALGVAAWLADEAGLDFVVAPVPTRDGAPLRPLGERHSVALYPFVEGEPGEFGDVVTAPRRAELVALLAELHHTTRRLPGGGPGGRAPGPLVPVLDPPVLDPAVLAGRPALTAALAALDRPWSGGPYAEPARALLARHGTAALHGALARFDALAARVAAEGGAPVLTHGEPHPGNVLRVPGRRPLLIDWDTVALAPPERDLWLLAPEGGDAERAVRQAYEAATGRAVYGPALDLHRLRWDLVDIAEFLDVLRSPHRASADTELAFTGLAAALGRVVAGAAGARETTRTQLPRRSSGERGGH
ncbi:phosphotransferase [Streptomyces sp. 4N509B]|uniref:phosphotransferase n=1 Tax=Streptomyces sp. 4N509B TaxID=3457413 RepID=UPI003FD0FBD2